MEREKSWAGEGFFGEFATKYQMNTKDTIRLNKKHMNDIPIQL
jgi:hypothetical protein